MLESGDLLAHSFTVQRGMGVRQCMDAVMSKRSTLTSHHVEVLGRLGAISGEQNHVTRLSKYLYAAGRRNSL